MLMRNRKLCRGVVVTLLAMGVAMSSAQADDDDDENHGSEKSEKHSAKYGGENRGKQVQPAQVNAKFKQECSACHIAYSPELLPAESWRKVMTGLDKHFGTDASLTDAERKEITTFLVNNSSKRWSAATAPLRITETSWFKSKHDTDEVPSSVWKSPQVKSPANCAACHTQAERGDFSERNIQMPN